MSNTADLDYTTITEGQRHAWSAGDFNVIARQLVSISEELVNAVDPHPGERVLDVACGSGNTSLVAARRYCDVVGIDFAPNLIKRARARALADGLDAEFVVADAQDLPFADGEFDVVLSVMGVMFAPDQERAASELLRVCKPGGRIGIAAWPPDGNIADFFLALADFSPPPPEGLNPPFRWGSEEGLRELLGDGVSEMRIERRNTRMFYRSPQHAVDVITHSFGPTITTMESLTDEQRADMNRVMLDLFERHNVSADGTMIEEPPFVMTVITRA